MNTYKVIATYKTICRTYVEADSYDQAIKIAEDMDGGLFKEIDTDSWEIYSVEEEK